eukprot:TRINITY_DN24216_c0_g1_i2.p1 TRINITY_DN24216_c0_g1~~TRINITY_DN24216_c0_g1_i2.p1  ORF type:complete len:165 (-),score=30.58 TRINITY_DN24216_c0_g1_i2:12-506(-)
MSKRCDVDGCKGWEFKSGKCRVHFKEPDPTPLTVPSKLTTSKSSEGLNAPAVPKSPSAAATSVPKSSSSTSSPPSQTSSKKDGDKEKPEKEKPGKPALSVLTSAPTDIDTGPKSPVTKDGYGGYKEGYMLKKADSLFGFGKWQRQIGRAVQQECRDRSRMPSSA